MTKKEQKKDNKKSINNENAEYLIEINKELQDQIIDDSDIFTVQENEVKDENEKKEHQGGDINNKANKDVKVKFEEKLSKITGKDKEINNELEKEIMEVENLMPGNFIQKPGYNKYPNRVDNNDHKKSGEQINSIRENVVIGDQSVVSKQIQEKKKEKEKFDKMRNQFKNKKGINMEKEFKDNNKEANETKINSSINTKVNNNEYKNTENKIIQEQRKQIEKYEKSLNNNNLKNLIGKILSYSYVLIFVLILFFAGKIYNSYFPKVNENQSGIITSQNTGDIIKHDSGSIIDYTNMELINIQGVSIDRFSERYNPLFKKNEKYVNTINYGVIKTKSINGEKIKCKNDISLDGYIVETGIAENESINGSKLLMVKNYECGPSLEPLKWYDFEVKDGYINGFVVNPFYEQTKLKIGIDEISQQEFTLSPGEEKNFSFKIDCNNLFKESNVLDYNFNIMLPGELSLYNRKIPFTLTKSKCSSLQLEKITINQYGTYNEEELVVPKGFPLTFSFDIVNIGGIDLSNITVNLKVVSDQMNNNGISFPSNNVMYEGEETNNINYILDNLEIGESKTVNITFKPLSAGRFKIQGIVKVNSINGVDVNFDKQILSYQNGIEFDYNIMKTIGTEKNESSTFNIDITNQNFPSNYKIELVGNEGVDSSDYDWYILKEKDVKKSGQQIFFRKLIPDSITENFLDTEETLKIQIIDYNKNIDYKLIITPYEDIQKSKIIDLN